MTEHDHDARALPDLSRVRDRLCSRHERTAVLRQVHPPDRRDPEADAIGTQSEDW